MIRLFLAALLFSLWPLTTVVAGEKFVVLLDWFTNPDHAPLYVAQGLGYFTDAGLDVELIAPADPNDPPKLVAAGKADIAALKARYDQSKVEFVLPYYSKPLFDLIYLGALDLWGERPQAILYANLVFFALAVWSMARVGEALFGGEIGLLA